MDTLTDHGKYRDAGLRRYVCLKKYKNVGRRAIYNMCNIQYKECKLK